MFDPSMTQDGSNHAYHAGMSSASALVQLERLDALAARLATGGSHTVAELATGLSVSPRTLARDLQLLRQRGAVIDSESGPGGGVRLSRASPSLAPLSLRESQAIELLLAMAASEALGLSLTGELAGVRAQLARAFAPADRTRIGALRQRIRVGTPVSAQVQQTRLPERPRVRRAVHTALVRYLRLKLAYTAGDGRRTQRQVEAHALLMAWPFWYLLAWDVERQAVRTFRLDRIESAEVTTAHFRPMPLQVFWDHCEGVGIAL
jgi:predicted DNA-binding transcriptional regulator YafY